MGGVVGIGRGDADEQVLVGFVGQQIAVPERPAELGQQRIAAAVDLDRGRAAASPISNRPSAAFAFFGAAGAVPFASAGAFTASWGIAGGRGHVVVLTSWLRTGPSLYPLFY